LDEKTQGDWTGRYGRAGCELAGGKTAAPTDVHVEWSDARHYIWARQTDDRRALVMLDGSRVAACRYAPTLDLTVDSQGRSRRLSLYYVDWDRQRTRQTFSVRGDDGTLLDWREVGDIQGGCYLTWEIQGAVRLTIEHQTGPNAVISGIFFDPAEPATSRGRP
jgi:hypothetical protein